MLRQGGTAFHAGEYQNAIQIYENGYESAKRVGNARSALHFLNNLGSVYYQSFRYRDAVQAYLKARDLAASQGEQEILAVLDSNLSSLYLDLGETESASESVDQGLKLPDSATARFRPQLLIQRARVQEQQKDWEKAAVLLHDAIDASRRKRDIATEAQAWNELGMVLLSGGQPSSAEPALLEALRLRKQIADDRPLYFTYESFGQLRMAQGNPQAASMFFDQALDAAPAVNPSALWQIYYERGNAHLAQARLEEAFADFQDALNSARRWRAEVLPADAFRVSTEVELHDVYSAYIELGSRLYAKTGRRQFAEDTFAAAEEDRASSLRALWAGPDLTRTLPNEYWETLAQLFRAEADLIKSGPQADAANVRRLRLRAAEMETRAGLDFPAETVEPDDAGLLERTRRTLGPGEVFLGFHLGNTRSLLWAVTHEGFELHDLPPRTQLANRVALFVKAVRDSSPEAVTLGHQLYSDLFANVSPGMRAKPLWMLAPDGALFEVPFAALIEESGSYVVERHAIQIVPRISALAHTVTAGLSQPVVGLGDPIYNRADPRLPRGQSYARLSKLVSVRAPAELLELARLVGSGREIETYAGVWQSHGYDPILLTGASANRQDLMTALRRNPSVVHIAAHILFPGKSSGPGLIALTLQPSGEVELLSATEITGMRLNLGLVVLNGCSSARAEALPGAGLMGLTRAWLAAGARGVIVTRWATSDQQQGQLFRSFYNLFCARPRSERPPSFARLLQQAQLAELQSGGERANPAYWAAYFCVEKN
jgi:CHAT domain-containing protein/tetratricopeptide (TPR) repeat protein